MFAKFKSRFQDLRQNNPLNLLKFTFAKFIRFAPQIDITSIPINILSSNFITNEILNFFHRFYGVIVANLKERPATTQALQVQYPNPQPYSDDSTYYITAGWNSNVPSSLKIGDGSTTSATRPNQGQQTYENRKLSRRTEYAVIVIVYLDSGVEGVSEGERGQ